MPAPGAAAGLPPFPPTWAAVRLYYEAVFAEAGLQLPDEALELLQNSSFAELTGCPGVCAYVPADFPSQNQASTGQEEGRQLVLEREGERKKRRVRPGRGSRGRLVIRRGRVRKGLLGRLGLRACKCAPGMPTSCLQTVPVVVAGPEADGSCPPAPAGAQPTQPDSVDETSKACDAEWQQALVS